MTYTYGPYYRPEELGLELIDTLDFSSGYYEYDYLCVWRHTESGKFYYAEDEGCSCPAPFGDIKSLDELQPLNNWVELITIIQSHTWVRNKNFQRERIAFTGKVREEFLNVRA